MPPQWNDFLLRLTLRGGSVYYFQQRQLTSAEPHYFIVLNIDPHGDEFLVTLVPSSRVQDVKRRRRELPAATLVEVDPTTCTVFPRQTIIDCNVWVRVTKGELLQKLQSGEASEKARIPEDILVKLRAGVLASPLVEEEIKEKLRS